MAIQPANTAPTEDETPPAMDYEAHRATYEGFLTLTKWSIAAVAVVVVALYFFIEGQQPLVGTFLLLLIPVGAVVGLITRTRRR